MTDDAKISMILCSELDPAEQEKMEHLDSPISEKFRRAGRVVRLCRGRMDGASRMLDFCHDPLGIEVVATVQATEFLAASDADALAMIIP
ncbi:MAG: hypothetical protein HQ581_06665 [Planctomycetes bacterium]|nr:hypothetical protein [Planctomycetota bacterium]